MIVPDILSNELILPDRRTVGSRHLIPSTIVSTLAPEAKPSLVNSCFSPHSPGRSRKMNSEYSSFSSESLGRLLDAATSQGWRERAEAAQALAMHLRDPRAFERLVAMLHDPDTAVIEAAVETLTKAGGVSGLEAVMEALGSDDIHVGEHIRDRLVSLWLAGEPVVERSREILAGNPSDTVRNAASELIETLTPNSD
jgi:HEAT repeats